MTEFSIDRNIVAHCEKRIHTEIFIPQETIIVLGSSNSADQEVHLDEAEARGIPVYKRAGGGGTVVLYPGSVVVSVGMWVEKPFENQFYFSELNQALIHLVADELQIEAGAMYQRGISDIAIGDKKFCGTSLFRSRTYLLYQASLIYSLDAQLISGLLRHPSREPDYRAGRSHNDFLCELSKYAPEKSVEDFCFGLNKNIERFQSKIHHFSTPSDSGVVSHLRRRFSISDKRST